MSHSLLFSNNSIWGHIFSLIHYFANESILVYVILMVASFALVLSGIITQSERWATFVAQIGFSIVMFLPAFGEEFGWRAYLMPKLMGICGKPSAMLIGIQHAK